MPAVDLYDFLVCVEAAVDVLGDVNGPAAQQFLVVVVGALERVAEAQAEFLLRFGVAEGVF